MKKEKEKEEFKIDIEEMAKAGLHFGRATPFLYPKMKEFVGGKRGKINIIDLFKAREEFKKALSFIGEAVSQGKVILFVGTKIPAREVVKKTAEECNFPYIIERWVGGLFTNFSNIMKRIKRMKELEKEKNEGKLEKYTKKERANLEEELQNLKEKFGGLESMESLPDIIFVVDPSKEKYCIEEAYKKEIKVIAVGNINTNPDKIDYLIPANDNTISSLNYILGKVKEVIIKNKK